MNKTMNKTILKAEANQSDQTDVAIADSNATVVLTTEKACEVACPSDLQPADGCEEAIRVLAHHKWEAVGCPAGDGLGFWLEAEREVNAERAGSSSAEE